MKEIFNLSTQFICEETNKIEDFQNFHYQSSLFALSLKRYFKQYAIPKGDIEIYLEDTYNFAVSFFGCLMAGMKVHILSKNVPSKKRLFINSENLYNFFTPHNFYHLEEPLGLDPHATFYVQTTGASGENKSIIKTVEQMIEEAKFLTQYLNISPNHTIFSSLSHQYFYGLSCKIFLPLVSGAKVNCDRLIEPSSIASFMKDKKDQPLIFLTVPYVLKQLSAVPDLEAFGAQCTIVSADSKLETVIREKFTINGCNSRVVDLYLSTESGVIAADEGDGLRIFDPVTVGLDLEERLIVESPWQKNIFNQGKFLSNDCASLEDGKIHLIGRYDRLIYFQDQKINLNDVQQDLKQHPLVADIFVGVTQNTHHVNVLVVLSDEGRSYFRKYGKIGIAEELKKHLKLELQDEVSFSIRRQLPYNSQSRITKSAFKECLYNEITAEFDFLKNTKNFILAEAYMGEDCIYFDDAPFVPGFTQLSFVYELIAKYWGIKSNQIAQIGSISFLFPIKPLDTLIVILKRNNNHLQFKMKINQQECTLGTMIIG